MPERRVVIKTFGCKVNQCESSFMLESLLRHGYRLAKPGEDADVCIVHGCAVTSRASYESRQALYQFRKHCPNATAYVFAGCAAHYEGHLLAERHLVTHVLGNAEKLRLTEFLESPATTEKPFVAVCDLRSCAPEVLKPLYYERMFDERSRAFIKIQDGCDAFCSYCVVPYTRGICRSLAPEEVAEQIRSLVVAGYKEVVLTGIHLGQWGRDLSPPKNILDLLSFLNEKGVAPPKIRLSSLEPTECSPELVGFLASQDWFCHHFHVPLQSGDPEVLKLMRRPYDPDFYADVIHLIRATFPNSAIGADVIVGFPGERDEMFEKTYRLIESLPITYLHVFPYSPRSGTPAANLKGIISGNEIRRRASMLRELGRKKKEIFMISQLHKELSVILESPLQKNVWRATSDNYLSVLVFSDGRELRKGDLARVKIIGVDHGRFMLVGRLI
ncbi:MAG: tRNA (N(6)-L-threonylcarbamoyladenosine(37)-C(2))-methylthiotransferase MtaB [Thermodesulforhabdaceae bacterium]